MEIRAAGLDDIDVIAALNGALFAEDAGQRDPLMDQGWPAREGRAYFADLLGGPHNVGFVAQEGGETVGYLVGRLREPARVRPVRIASLESIFVQEEHRSQGIGEQLTARFLDWARQQGADRVEVVAYAANEAAIRFYRRLGFIPHNVVLERDLS